MPGRMLKHGDSVRTPSGATGRIIKRSNNPFVERQEYEFYDLQGKRDVLVYTVLMEDGEVRRFSFEALAAANNAG